MYNAAVLSRAYVELLAITHFCQRIAENDVEPSSRVVLEKLGILYGLSCLDKHLVYFYKGRYATTPVFIEVIKDSVLYLCDVLKCDVISVVDAMAPPDFALNSVLGKADGNVSIFS